MVNTTAQTLRPAPHMKITFGTLRNFATNVLTTPSNSLFSLEGMASIFTFIVTKGAPTMTDLNTIIDGTYVTNEVVFITNVFAILLMLSIAKSPCHPIYSFADTVFTYLLSVFAEQLLGHSIYPWEYAAIRTIVFLVLQLIYKKDLTFSAILKKFIQVLLTECVQKITTFAIQTLIPQENLVHGILSLFGLAQQAGRTARKVIASGGGNGASGEM